MLSISIDIRELEPKDRRKGDSREILLPINANTSSQIRMLASLPHRFFQALQLSMNLHGFIFSWRSVSSNDNAIESKYQPVLFTFSPNHFIESNENYTPNSCSHFLKTLV